jgi:hypothetical protein
MTTKAEFIIKLKLENPTLQIGDDEQGYTQLSAADYEAQIAEWADARLAKEEKEAAKEKVATDKAALLAKLGITADEAALLVG